MDRACLSPQGKHPKRGPVVELSRRWPDDIRDWHCRMWRHWPCPAAGGRRRDPGSAGCRSDQPHGLHGGGLPCHPECTSPLRGPGRIGPPLVAAGRNGRRACGPFPGRSGLWGRQGPDGHKHWRPAGAPGHYRSGSYHELPSVRPLRRNCRPGRDQVRLPGQGGHRRNGLAKTNHRPGGRPVSAGKRNPSLRFYRGD